MFTLLMDITGKTPGKCWLLVAVIPLFVVVVIPQLVVAVASNSQNKKFKGTDGHLCQQGVCLSNSDESVRTEHLNS